MTRYVFTALLVAALLSVAIDSRVEGRGGLYGGGFHGGLYGGGFHGWGVAGPFGAGYGSYHFNPVVGPYGGIHTGSMSGSYTTIGGTNIKYGGAGVGTSGPFGGAAGKGFGGVQVTTPGGHTYDKFGKAGGAVGTYGAGLSRYQGGVAIGPHGAVGGHSKVGVGVGTGGTHIGDFHGSAAVGHHGVVGGKVGVIGTGTGGVVHYGTHYTPSSVLASRGSLVRQNFAYHNVFTPTWYTRYPGSWRIPGWNAARIWYWPIWINISIFINFPGPPIYYDFGTTVVYQNNIVYINGEPSGSTQAYNQQAQEIAAAGQAAPVNKNPNDWEPLGVFAVVKGDEKESTNIFQLAVNKQGIIKGNYYNALTDTTVPLAGSVDKKSQRAAWTVGDKKFPVFEAGIANLTQAETTMLVHTADEKTQQVLLVRVEQAKGEK